MDDVLCRVDLDTGRFFGRGQSDVVGAKHDIEKSGVVGAVY